MLDIAIFFEIMKGRKESKMKKTLAILLSLALVICMIPATASANPDTRIDLSEESVVITPTVTPESGVYNEEVQTPTLTLKVGDVILEQGKDFNVTWTATGKTKVMDAATYTAKVDAIAESTKCKGSKDAVATFTIAPYNYNTNKITIGIDNQVNDVTTFEAIKGSFHYYKDGKEVSAAEKAFLEKGVTGSAPSKVGETDQYKVTFTKATGNFDGTIPEAYYKKAENINLATVSPKPGYTISNNTINAGTYNGQAKTVTSMFKLKDGTSPIDPINYTISCVEDKTSKEVYAPKNAGTYTISIVGKEAYGSTKILNLEIAAKDATKTVTIDTITETYVAGKWDGLEPVVRDTSLGKLTRGVDYIMKTPTSSGNVGTVVFEFMGNYVGTKSADFNVVSSDYDIATVANVTFANGSSYLTKSVMYSSKKAVIDELQTMSVKKADGTSLAGYYNIKYGYINEKGVEEVIDSPVNAGTYTIYIEGRSPYAGKKAIGSLTIEKFSFAYINAVATQGSYTNNPNVTVKSFDNSITFVKDKDYTLTGAYISTYTNKGYVTVKSTGAGNLAAGEKQLTYSLSTKNISSCHVEFATGSKQSYQYTGSVIKPQVKVRDGYTPLTEGTDYTVSYKDAAGKVVYSPKDAGTYTIVIEGKGAYSGTTTLTFYIVGTDISGYTVTLKESSVNATGYAQTPVILSVKKGVYSSLTSNDYTVTYQDATGKTVTSMSAPGTYKVVVTGKNGYSGSTYATFRIVGLPQTVTVNQDSYKVYTTSDSFKITAKATGDGTGFTYTSSNPAVASVSAAGYVTIHKVGRAVITVTTTGNKKYEPTSKDVTVKVYPSKAKISQKPSTDGKKAQMKVRWGYQDGVTKYQIRYSRDKNFKSGSYLTKTVKAHGKSYTTQSTTISNLKSGYTYYFKVRAVYTDPYTGDTYYGSWSPWRSAKTK